MLAITDFSIKLRFIPTIQLSVYDCVLQSEVYSDGRTEVAVVEYSKLLEKVIIEGSLSPSTSPCLANYTAIIMLGIIRLYAVNCYINEINCIIST